MNTHIDVTTAIGRVPVYVHEDLGDLVITSNLRSPLDAKKYMLTHRATGYGIATHNNRRELKQFARQLLRSHDWSFTDPKHSLALKGVWPSILAWKEQVAK